MAIENKWTYYRFLSYMGSGGYRTDRSKDIAQVYHDGKWNDDALNAHNPREIERACTLVDTEYEAIHGLPNEDVLINGTVEEIAAHRAEQERKTMSPLKKTPVGEDADYKSADETIDPGKDGLSIEAVYSARGITYKSDRACYVRTAKCPLRQNLSPGQTVLVEGAGEFLILSLIIGPDGPWNGETRTVGIGPGLVLDAGEGNTCDALGNGCAIVDWWGSGGKTAEETVAEAPAPQPYRCEEHALTSVELPVCVPCMIESIQTLTQEVARLEGERDDAWQRLRDISTSHGGGAACNVSLDTAIADVVSLVVSHVEKAKAPVDPSANLQHLLDRVKEMERILEDLTQTVVPAAEKKLGDLDKCVVALQGRTTGLERALAITNNIVANNVTLLGQVDTCDA